MDGGKFLKKTYAAANSIIPLQCIISYLNNIVYFWISVGHQAGVEKGVGRDGGKSICLDDIHTDIKNKECLIYSFGIADDWTFEEYMASLGCKVIILHTFILIPFEKFKLRMSTWNQNQ